jgi:hypothetical protein
MACAQAPLVPHSNEFQRSTGWGPRHHLRHDRLRHHHHHHRRRIIVAGVLNIVFGMLDVAATIIAADVPKVTFGMVDLAITTTTIIAAATP